MTYLYTLNGCKACAKIAEELSVKGVEFRKVEIDNPLVELGVQGLFKDGKVHAPVMVTPGDGIFIADPLQPERLFRIVNLSHDSSPDATGYSSPAEPVSLTG